jgi:Glycosyltransferase family 87
MRFVERHRLMAGCGIIVVSGLFWFPRLAGAWMQTGGEPFQGVANDFMDGKLPYRDRLLEYPPYSIPIFLLPRLLFGKDNYLGGFTVLVFAADCAVKALLLYFGLQTSKTARALLPVLVYSVGIPFLQDFFLLRFDIWPALICLIAIWLTCSNRYFLCGLAIAAGIGVKVYPAVLAPPLFVLALRQKNGTRFAIGLAAGLFPIVMLGFVLPWWRFAQFQGARGLQVESLYASLLWMAEQLGLAQVTWEWNTSWFEVHGPLAAAVLPWAQGVYLLAVITSFVLGGLAAARCDTVTPAKVARLLLIPLLGFVVFNLVFSPQFMIWLLPIAALGALEENPWPMLAVLLATLLTPIFYPCPEYNRGLNFYETVALLYRNLLLLYVFVWLIRGLRRTNASQTFRFEGRMQQTMPTDESSLR